MTVRTNLLAAFAAAALVLGAGLASCSNGEGEASTASAAALRAQAQVSTQARASEATASEAASTGVLTNDSLMVVRVLVPAGDFAGTASLAAGIADGSMAGTVVQIDATVARSEDSGARVLATQRTVTVPAAQAAEGEDGEETATATPQTVTETAEVPFAIQGADEADYPPEGARVILTGKVIAAGNGYVLGTLPNFVSVVG